MGLAFLRFPVCLLWDHLCVWTAIPRRPFTEGALSLGCLQWKKVSLPWEVIFLSMQLVQDSLTCVLAWVASTLLKSSTNLECVNGSLSSFGGLSLAPMMPSISMAVSSLSQARAKLSTCQIMHVVLPLHALSWVCCFVVCGVLEIAGVLT